MRHASRRMPRSNRQAQGSETPQGRRREQVMTNGYHVHEVNPFYVQAVAEHRELHAAVEGIRKNLAARNEREADAKDVKLALCEIRCLRDKLDHHFAQE